MNSCFAVVVVLVHAHQRESELQGIIVVVFAAVTLTRLGLFEELFGSSDDLLYY